MKSERFSNFFKKMPQARLIAAVKSQLLEKQGQQID
jgi:hypothetical protein